VTPPETKPKTVDYDERIYRKGHPPHRIRNAVILLLIVVIGTYFAVAKSIPFSQEYELRAVFENAANIRKDSPVRIAGVNVGEVKSVRSLSDSDDPDLQNAAEVTFSVKEDGRPIHTDAQVEIRPRIFLEGNFFLDVKPGSPSAPELDDDGTIPITQTATAVQLDQILTTLQAPDRENLQKLLQGYGTALNHQPTAAEDKGQDPDVQGESAAKAISDSFQYGESAGRDSAIVSEALLGENPGDLSGLISAQSRIFGALLNREAQLQDLITNFNVTAGAFASESVNLSATVRLLAPTLEEAIPSLRATNSTFPYLRAFARDIQPGLRELPATIRTSSPWMRQMALLLRQSELGNVADELRIMAPSTGAAAGAGAGLFNQLELTSRCVSNVLVPTGNVVVNDLFPTGQENYKEFLYGLTEFGTGEGQNFDGNGPYLRFQSGGGAPGSNIVSGAQPGGGIGGETLYGRMPLAPQGSQPVSGSKPPFRTDVPCYISPVPDVNGPRAAVGPASPAP
jgi:phospholipid/cholesterol/gamma-HCH transport system substrate-binding protein